MAAHPSEEEEEEEPVVALEIHLVEALASLSVGTANQVAGVSVEEVVVDYKEGGWEEEVVALASPLVGVVDLARRLEDLALALMGLEARAHLVHLLLEVGL